MAGRVGDELIRPIVRSLDDMPALTRQLADMIRKHKKKQRENNDGVNDVDRFDGDATRIEVRVKRFKQNPKHDTDEFNRQLDEQMDQIQRMSLADWLRNREAYEADGRPSESNRAQQNERDQAFLDMYNALRKEGVDRDTAKQAATDWLATQSATHRLDGIAGGDVTDISWVGDARVNSSLGSQWRTRIGDIQSQVDAFVAANPGVDLDNVFLNVLFR